MDISTENGLTNPRETSPSSDSGVHSWTEHCVDSTREHERLNSTRVFAAQSDFSDDSSEFSGWNAAHPFLFNRYCQLVWGLCPNSSDSTGKGGAGLSCYC